MRLKISSLTQAEISAFMREMGQRGGRIGGKRRLETMTPQQRSAAALKAARARWNRHKTWTRESWAVGTRFQIRWSDGEKWSGCVIDAYTAVRVCWHYPPYDDHGLKPGSRRYRLAEFVQGIAAGTIRHEETP